MRKQALSFTPNSPLLLNRFHVRFSNVTQRRSRIFRQLPRAAQQSSHPQKPAPEAPRPGLLTRLQLTPLNSPALLRGPEAVVAVIAVGMVMAVAFLANASRRIASDIAQRARNITTIRQLQASKLNKLQQQQYLESAVEATRATLLNTESFLAAQVKRAEIAEQRLEELNSTRKEVEAAMENTRQKRADLIDVERALQIERGKAEVNETLVLRLEENITLRKESLQVCETDAELAHRALQEAEESANHSLQMALRDKEDLERALEQKRIQLEFELEERNQFMETFADAERELESASGTFEKTISDLETRRQRIDRVSAEAEAIKNVLTQKEANLQAVVEGEVNASQIEDSLHQIQSEQKNIRSSLEEMKVVEQEKTSQRKILLEKVTAREIEIAELRNRLEVLHKSRTEPNNAQDGELGDQVNPTISSSPNIANPGEAEEVSMKESAIQNNFESPEVDLPNADDVGPHSDQNPVKATKSQSLRKMTDGTAQFTEGDLQTSDELVSSDKVVMESSAQKEAQQPAPRRRVGRPRKTPSSSSAVKSSPDAPKRGRGRPRKVVAAGDTSSEVAPKRKRGRPRKNPLPEPAAE